MKVTEMKKRIKQMIVECQKVGSTRLRLAQIKGQAIELREKVADFPTLREVLGDVCTLRTYKQIEDKLTEGVALITEAQKAARPSKQVIALAGGKPVIDHRREVLQRKLLNARLLLEAIAERKKQCTGLDVVILQKDTGRAMTMQSAGIVSWVPVMQGMTFKTRLHARNCLLHVRIKTDGLCVMDCYTALSQMGDAVEQEISALSLSVNI